MATKPIDANAVQEAELQVREKQSEVKYDSRDFTVDHIVNSFRDGLFYIPDYQRESLWHRAKQSRLIESVLLGLPIPMMFLAEMDDGRLEIVDGVQRISSLEAFRSGDLRLEKLERLDQLNGFSFADLPVALQRRLSVRALRLVILDVSTSFETRQDIFSRVNTGGEHARPSEVRRGALQGPFMNFLEHCAQNALFRRLCPISPGLVARREPLELVVRFFAFSEIYREFRHDVAPFLDKFIKAHREEFERDRFEHEFQSMLAFVAANFPAGFAKTKNAKSTPRVRFEAIAVGTNLALRINADLVPASMDWLDSAEFGSTTTTHASNSGPRLRARVEFVRDRLLAT